MITHFLTSSPFFGYDGDLNPANWLIDELHARLPQPLKCLLITSAPDDIEMTDRMAWGVREAFDHVDLSFDHYEVLDRRTQRWAARMIKEANFIILSGGHVPTENKFFTELKLRTKLKNWHGVIVSISAGSMNCADIVYASPEMEGESIDPEYQLFLRGLGLTNINILPHLEMLRTYVLDGRDLLKDIVHSHSYSVPVFCLNDGSYFLIQNGRSELRGEAYLYHKGIMKQICKDGERKILCKNGTLRTIK